MIKTIIKPLIPNKNAINDILNNFHVLLNALLKRYKLKENNMYYRYRGFKSNVKFKWMWKVDMEAAYSKLEFYAKKFICCY